MRCAVAGVDPGRKGGIAFLRPWLAMDRPEVASLFDMPVKSAYEVDTLELVTILRCEPLRMIFVEQQTSRPRQAGQFVMGINYGRILGCLEAHGLPYATISPSEWKFTMGLSGTDKMMSVALAEALVPGAKDQLRGPRGAGRDGRAEALLLSYFGALKLDPVWRATHEQIDVG
jgi:hypothetical protein